MRYFLQLAYQGTNYHGWQLQPNACTVQGVIQNKLFQLLSTPINITGSSRTDTGVHAKEQWAHIDIDFFINTTTLQHKLNAILPSDIAILGIYPVQSTAHARFDATHRTYVYKISRTKDPFCQDTAFVFQKDLDVSLMNIAAATLKEQKDFESFSKTDATTRLSYICNILEASWKINEDDQLIFKIKANRFLRGMVRAIVANLLEVGLKKYTIEHFNYILEKKDRSLSASLVPAHGLTLTKISYPDNIFTVTT